MNKEESVQLIEQWVESAKKIEIPLDKMSDIFMASPENELSSSVWLMFDKYTQSLAKLIGDEDGWLDWFAWDCDFGRNAKEMTFPNGETLLVVGAGDLIDAIKTNEDGNRIW